MIDEPDRAVLWPWQFGRQVDSEALIHGGRDLGRGHGAVFGCVTNLIRRPHHSSALDGTAGKEAGPACGVMVAAPRRIYLRASAQIRRMPVPWCCRAFRDLFRSSSNAVYALSKLGPTSFL